MSKTKQVLSWTNLKTIMDILKIVGDKYANISDKQQNVRDKRRFGPYKHIQNTLKGELI